jgi:hypothetical protein
MSKERKLRLIESFHRRDWPAFEAAVREGRREIAEMRKNGESLWIEAARQGQARAIEILGPESDPDERDEWGNTALHLAIKSQGTVEKIHEAALAAAKWCDPQATNEHGKDALMLAAQLDRSMVVIALLPSSNPMARDSHAESALSHALQSESHESAQALAPCSELDGEFGRGKKTLMQIACTGAEARCADAIARVERPDELREAIERFGVERLPRVQALIEAIELGQAAQGASGEKTTRESQMAAPRRPKSL